MTPFDTLTGIAVPFGQENVDTDIIIPAKYLKSVTRTGLGMGAFDSIRQDPDNIFDTQRNAGAPILIAGDNFGCGSSREHAPWALADMGFRCVIAPSFADIFSGNAFKNGMLLVELPQEQVDRLMEVAKTDEITIDLENQVVTTPFQDRFEFDIDPFRKHCLMNGLDEIGLTEQLAGDIDAFEQRRSADMPFLDPVT
ncbi:3-isopropylmalate dehydratase small subunit [Pacificimonas flava]|uniref:3-isopropylmalate dehydratase small subunit n=2 Tax=Pacificimonas TaxID=1960290 RepID=A0A219B3G9_9SPHN|nr:MULTISPECIES: 3-isopropylmalate dehydratase small subunit [Pacificimonas]MBZ6377983.1 3-isopropylmalate dehydratase small subunit [Pacificimonas aurantium]OWV32369.1 3-isopropylmalate dehydratase small subunit [Pacificimonas flava]